MMIPQIATVVVDEVDVTVLRVDLPVQEYYTVLQVSHLLYMSTPQIYDLIKRGRMKAVTIDDRVRIAHDSMMDYIRMRTEQVAASSVIKPYVPPELTGVQPTHKDRPDQLSYVVVKD